MNILNPGAQPAIVYRAAQILARSFDLRIVNVDEGDDPLWEKYHSPGDCAFFFAVFNLDGLVAKACDEFVLLAKLNEMAVQKQGLHVCIEPACGHLIPKHIQFCEECSRNF